ncbi:acyltransferase [Massilia sp. Dwa41.01b]|uniref:acyltransferase family protein n=1 Tax=unclassified Massilia TaxID=2609279 RepID=UPI001601D5C7|nr:MULTISPECIES: acyltransferase [unclassified Massilia]QNA87462.1 acyltransferase [Massilia sp. Dwa41.01b]QNA98368.1 acyltransferase [Massilia sp. Se16.2.3]
MSAAGVTAPRANGAGGNQFFLINLLKAGAAQLIVLHHLAFYGPMADHARQLAPALFDWLAADARIAVQVFLVVGGFLAAKSLSPRGLPGLSNPLATIWRRYLKLAPPFLVAMLLAIGASALASTWMTHDSIAAPPSFGQLSAHALLLHDVLGYEALSAGAWYVAIDFQLYAAMSLLLWGCGRFAGGRNLPWLMPIVMTIVVAASLLYFNLDSDWDVWAPYFLGSYGLGALAWWASDPARRPRAVALLLLMMVVPALLALTLDFRSRIAVALAVACVLMLCGRTQTAPTGMWPLVNRLAKISYSVFLIHFPVCLVVNAAFTQFVPTQSHLQAAGTLFAWIASLAAGALFFRWIERPLGQMAKLRPSSRDALAFNATR